MPGGHFLQQIRASFANRSSQTAIRDGERTLTFSELDARAQRCAAWLQGLGVEPGDRVALMTPAKWRFLVAHLGALYAGAIALPTNPRFPQDELRHILQDSGAKVVIAGDDQRTTIELLQPQLPDLRTIASDLAAGERPCATFRDHDPAADAPCLMLYSSGTTGRPKGVVHSHANLAASLTALGECWRISEDDTVVNALPLFHIHGLSFATHLCWLSGAGMIMEESFHPRRILQTIGQGTVFMAIPTFYYALLDRPEFAAAAHAWERTRLFTCGSAPIRPEVLPRLEETLGHPIINRYGMTEAHVIASLPLDGPWPSGSVGLPLRGLDLRLRRDDGSAAAPGEVGSVEVRGPNLFREYWRNPAATSAAFASGWFETGDMGRLDDKGFLTLVGRKHDLIITRGFNVYPQVVERVINECPGVRESAVIGLADRLRGERVVAVVVRSDPALDEAALRRHCKDLLSEYELPSAFQFVTELPRNAMGKVLRRQLVNDVSTAI